MCGSMYMRPGGRPPYATRAGSTRSQAAQHPQRKHHQPGHGEAEAGEALIEGVELTLRELTNVFSKHGMTTIKPEVGDKFDPKMHEAMFEAPVPGTKAGEIIQVSAEGFLLYDRLLRPAQVGVSSMQG